MLFISKYAPKVRYNIEIDVEQQFCRDMVDFHDIFLDKPYAKREEYLKQLEEEFENVNEMEKIFLQLTSDFCVIHRKNIKDVLEFSKEIAVYIIGFIEAFYGLGSYQEENVHTAFLRDLYSDDMVRAGNVVVMEA